MIPYQPAIEAASSHKLTVIPNKSSIGIQALFEKRADFAMISGPLSDEIAALSGINPNLNFKDLQVFPVSSARMSFAIHPGNRVRQISTAAMKQVLLGQIVNWKDLGGDDRPIRLVIVREGGGVQATVESLMLNGSKINTPDPIRVQISTQVLKIVEQEPGAIGLAQLTALIEAKGTELVLDKPVTQTLSLVTLGDPTPEMRKLITAIEHVATVNRTKQKTAMATRLIRNRLGIAAKLYCVAALSGAAVAALVFASIHFAGVTEQAASRLYRDGFAGIQAVTNLQALLEQHRRIVESAPAEVDRVRLEASQRAMIDNSAQLASLVRELTNSKSDPVQDALELKMQGQLPNLIKSGQEVLFFAYNFAQDNALAEATKYSALASQFEDQIKLYRAHRLELANSAVKSMFDSARSLTLWVSISALAALVLIGPLGLTITSSVLRRLARITASMTRLANNDASAEVPSRGDRDEVGNMARAVQVFKENAVELLLRKTEAEQATFRLGVAIDNMTHGLCMFGADQRMIICNDRYKAMYELPDDLVQPGTAWSDILSHREKLGMLGKSMRQILGERIEASKSGVSSYTNALPDGRVIAVSRQAMPEGGWVAVHEDVTERQHAEARITHLAHHDQLTDLPNRTFFREELSQALTRMRPDETFAVLWLDLDRFKSVNDTLGHSIGDALLKLVGMRLRSCAGPGNFTARLGGDEFSIICGHGQTPEEIGRMAQRIIDSISQPFAIDQHQVVVGTTIGIAMAPNDGIDPDHLLKNADIAMYRAKADGRGTYRFFEADMDRLIQSRRALEIDLRQALNNGQLELYYQPLINRVSGTVTAMEALLRWNHPTRGLVQPGDFIPLAEEAGLISALGEWVVRTACAEALTWPSDIKVAVNLSAIQFKGGNLVHTILSALARTGLVASRLEVEITESVLLDDDPATVAVLHQLRGLGVRIVMDDFGTGYSSLSYFRRFPFDKIKIDRSFIRDVTDESDGLAIVRSIIQLAKSLKIDVVAEGVETAEQLRIVSQEGCTEFQGYFFSKPQPASRIADVITRCGRQMKAVA